MTAKKLVYSKAFLELYPLEKDNDICAKINKYATGYLDDENLQELYICLKSEQSLKQSDLETAQKNINNCYRSNLYRDKSREKKKLFSLNINFERTEKVKRTYSGEDGIDKYKKDYVEVEENIADIKNTVEAFENGEINETHLPLLNEILYRNRLKKIVWWILLAAVIAVIIIMIICSII